MLTSTRKWVLLAFVLFMMATIIACSGGNNNKAETTPTPSTKPASSNDNQATNDAPAPRGKISVSIYDRGNVPAEEGTIDNNRWTKWMNENGPNDITWVPVPRSESVARFNTLFASGDGPDLILEFDRNYLTELYYKKQLQPIGDLIEQHSVHYKAKLEQFPELRQVTTFEDGQIYGLARLVQTTPGGALLIRADWLENLNLDLPQKTADFFEVAKAFTERDPDQNGQNDTFGMALSHRSGAAISHMFGISMTFSEKDMRVIEGDTIVLAWDRLKAATELQKQLFDNRIVDRDFLTDRDGKKAEQDFLSGKLGMYFYTGAINSKPNYETFFKNNPGAKLAVLRLPESEFGRYSVLWHNPVQNVGAVNALAKDPVSVIKHVDFMFEEETMNIIKYGIEGQHYNIDANGCYISIVSEENTLQRRYLGDFGMMYDSVIANPSCQAPAFEDAALTEQWQQFRLDAYSEYAADPLPVLMVHTEHSPALPEDLRLIDNSGMERIYDLMSQAIVGGASVSVEQAINEAKGYWEKSGGANVDAWYAQWYKDNKDTAMLASKIDSFRKTSLFE